MNRDIDFARCERLFEFFDEQSFAADIGERSGRELVAAGANFDDLDFEFGNLRRQPRAHYRRLRQRELARPRSNFDFKLWLKRHPFSDRHHRADKPRFAVRAQESFSPPTVVRRRRYEAG